MFKGDSADTLAGKFPLVSMGGRAEGLACADPIARIPIGASGNFVCLSSQADNLTFKDVTELNIHTSESWELPAAWLVSTCLNMVWDERLAGRRATFVVCQAELSAKIALLRSTKWKHYSLHNSALLLDEVLNLHFS